MFARDYIWPGLRPVLTALDVGLDDLRARPRVHRRAGRQAERQQHPAEARPRLFEQPRDRVVHECDRAGDDLGEGDVRVKVEADLGGQRDHQADDVRHESTDDRIEHGHLPFRLASHRSTTGRNFDRHPASSASGSGVGCGVGWSSGTKTVASPSSRSSRS